MFFTHNFKKIIFPAEILAFERISIGSPNIKNLILGLFLLEKIHYLQQDTQNFKELFWTTYRG